MTKPASKDPTAYVLYEALQRLGSKADPKALVAQVKKLSLGLPAEDEFMTLLTWLGRSHLVHKLDQLTTPPAVKTKYRVPDLLAVFEHEGREIAVLIEVKAKQARTKALGRLSWKPEYYHGLQSYAEILDLPLLVAWKIKPFGLWALCELRHFTRSHQNYKLTFEIAMKQSLMGLLAGDFGYILEPGVGMHMTFRKLRPVNLKTLAPGARFAARIEDAHFTDAHGKRFTRFGEVLWPLFLAADQDVEIEEDEDCVRQSFVIPQAPKIEFAHRALPIGLSLRARAKDGIPWRQLLEQERIPAPSTPLGQGAKAFLGKGVLRTVLNQMPASPPLFLRTTS